MQGVNSEVALVGRVEMESLIDSVSRIVSRQWEIATPNDFGALALTLITACWFFSRYCDR